MKQKTLPILSVGLAAALLGALVGALSAGFLHFIELGQHWLWQELSASLPWQTLIVCTLGGILVGVCQRYLGNHPPSLNESIAALRKTGRLEYGHLPHGLVTASASLLFGASLGPEAAIMDLLGGLSTWSTDTLNALRQRLNLPRPTATNRLRRLLQGWPNLIALVVGTVAFFKALGGLYSGGLLRLTVPFQWSDLLWSVPLALVGALGGALFLALQAGVQQWVAPLERKPILRGAIGGLALGLSAQFLPLVLFSGQHALQPAYDQAAQLGFWTLLLTALARLLLVNLLLATGWKGGQFLPLMFSGGTLGLAVCTLFPMVPASVATLGAMAALTAVVLPVPLIALILMALLFPPHFLGISVVAVGLVMAGQWAWKKAPRPATPSPALAPSGD